MPQHVTEGHRGLHAGLSGNDCAKVSDVTRTEACVMDRRLADSDFRGHPDVRLMIMYSEALAHLIYAAADIVLVRLAIAIGMHPGGLGR